MDPTLLPIHLKKALAFLYILTERLIVSFGLAMAWAGFWCALFITTLLPEGWSAITAIVFWFGLTVLMVKGMATFLIPDKRDTFARLEKDSGLMHRPLQNMDDVPAFPETSFSKNLWNDVLAWKRSAFSKITWPRLWTDLARRDPLGLRIALALILVVAVVMAGPEAGKNLRGGLWPWVITPPRQEASIRAWITPPPYTGQGQISITGPGRVPKDKAPVIPENSKIKITMEADWIAPTLKMGETEIQLKKISDHAYGIETDIPQTKAITITQLGFPRLYVPINWTDDLPPTVELNGDPTRLPRGEVRFSIKVQDDYGIRDLKIDATLSPEVKDKPWRDLPFHETRALSLRMKAEPTAISPIVDFTQHPWAGLPAQVTLTVVDHAGQEAPAGPVTVVLPERRFENPIAQKIADVRKELIWHGPGASLPMSYALENLLFKPYEYQHQAIITLALRSAASRLILDPSDKGVIEVIDILWSAALQLEDGNLTLAMQNMREIQKELSEALQNGAPPEEIQALMQKFREAMVEYLQSLQKEVQQRMAEGKMTMISPDMLKNAINPNMLNEFLEQMEQDMMNGDMDKAMEKLSQLQQMMEGMDPSMAQEMPEDIKEMSEQLKQMQTLIDQQQNLLDQTKNQAELMKNSSIVTTKNKTEQEALRFMLGQIMRDIGEKAGDIPQELGEAEHSMRGSSGELGQNRPDNAVPHQQEALDKLRQGQQQMQKQLAQRLQNMMGFSFGGMPKDPFGRGRAGPTGLSDETVEIPTEAQRKKIDDIINILRERSADQNRSAAERDYYKRLLRQW